MRKSTKNLRLRRESLRVLTDDQKRRIAGGSPRPPNAGPIDDPDRDLSRVVGGRYYPCDKR